MADDHTPALDLRQLKVLSALGRGARGVVFLVQNESSDGQLFALKTILKASITKKVEKTDEYDPISFEQEVLRLLQHPLLPKLGGVLSTEKIVAYAIDYCPGRDLNHLRSKQTDRMFSEDVIRFYAAELVIALEYLHGLGIVYRDLKPENVMIQANGHIMLVDFDLSTRLSPKSPSETRSTHHTSLPKPNPNNTNRFRFSFFSKCFHPTIPSEESVHPAESITNSFSKSNSFVGTEEYIAPEMLHGNGHGFSVDWWCLGVVLHEMLYGKTPFKGSNRKETFHRILSTSPEIAGEPSPLRDLIRRLLVKDPKRRISPAEMKGHDFFRGVEWENVVEIARPPFVPPPSDEEGMGVNKMDIEAFVEGVFRLEGEGEGDGDVERKEEALDFLTF